MEEYRKTREKREKVGVVTGVAATVAIHVLALVFALGSGLTYLDPPPPERAPLLIEFEEFLDTPQEVIETRTGHQPVAEEVDREKDVELVQRAESPVKDSRPNTTTESAPDPHGDVEVPTPPVEEPVLDPRAAFPGMGKKVTDDTTPHSSTDQDKDLFKAGQPDGNAIEAKTDGVSNAHLEGRTVQGSLPRPAYSSQVSGVVVVRIKVDQWGTVTEAVPGADGTTVTDKNLWTAARNAALKAHFNQAADAPAIQTGTITYIFKLK